MSERHRLSETISKEVYDEFASWCEWWGNKPSVLIERVLKLWVQLPPLSYLTFVPDDKRDAFMRHIESQIEEFQTHERKEADAKRERPAA